MICPHCQFQVPEYKAEWNPKAAPKIGNFSLCLECGGFSVIIARDKLRAATKQEHDSIKRAPEMLLLGQLREYGYKLHSSAENPKKKK